MRVFHLGALALYCFLAFGKSPAFAAVPASASQHAELSGVVTDSSGAAVPNAAVSLETSSGKKVASTVTDAIGHYRLEISGQLEATYRERVTAQGFRTIIEETSRSLTERAGKMIFT